MESTVVLEERLTMQRFESEPYPTGVALDVRCRCGGRVHPIIGAWCCSCGAKVVQLRLLYGDQGDIAVHSCGRTDLQTAEQGPAQHPEGRAGGDPRRGNEAVSVDFEAFGRPFRI